jgi:hypothetical protein
MVGPGLPACRMEVASRWSELGHPSEARDLPVRASIRPTKRPLNPGPLSPNTENVPGGEGEKLGKRRHPGRHQGSPAAGQAALGYEAGGPLGDQIGKTRPPAAFTNVSSLVEDAPLPFPIRTQRHVGFRLAPTTRERGLGR